MVKQKAYECENHHSQKSIHKKSICLQSMFKDSLKHEKKDNDDQCQQGEANKGSHQDEKHLRK